MANYVSEHTGSQIDEAVAWALNKSVALPSELAGKADVATTYTKAEVDEALTTKANVSDVYTKTQTYTKAEIDAKVGGISKVKLNGQEIEINSTDNSVNIEPQAVDIMYGLDDGESVTITNVGAVLDSLLPAVARKAEQSSTYTKTEVDNALKDINASYVKVVNAMIDGSLIADSNVKAVLQTLGDKISTLRGLAIEKANKHLFVTLAVSDGANVADYSANEIANAAGPEGRLVLARVTNTNQNTYSYSIPLARVTYVRSLGQNVADFVCVQPKINDNGSMTANDMSVTVFRVFQDKSWSIVYDKLLVSNSDWTSLMNYLDSNFAPLGNGVVPERVLPSSALNVIEGTLHSGDFYSWEDNGGVISYSTPPYPHREKCIYIDTLSNKIYRWDSSTSAYVLLNS